MTKESQENAKTTLGKIAGIQGEVVLSGPNGEQAQGHPGDQLFLGSTLTTFGSSIVVLKLDGLNPISLGHDETLTISQDFLDKLKEEEEETSLGGDVNFDLIAQAVESGESLEELLPATAAGGEGAQGGSSSSSSASGARIELTGDTVTPQSGFETSGPSTTTIDSFIDNPEFFNSQPYTSGLTDVAVNEDASVVLDLSQSFFDDDAGQTLTFSINELPDGLSFDETSGVISGAATNDAAFTQGGSYLVSVTATDDSGAANNSVTTDFSLSVNNVNDAPTVAGPIVLGQMNEDGSITIGSATLLDGTNDIDLFDVLSVDDVKVDSGEGEVVDNGNGTFTYLPGENWFGDAVFSYVISDGEGGFVENTGNLVVLSVNDNPVANADAALSTTPNVSVNADVLANDEDVDGDALTITSATAENGSVTIESDGTITYTPNEGYFGADQVSYTISDGVGGEAQSTIPVSVIYNPANLSIDNVSTEGVATPSISGSSENIVGGITVEVNSQQYEAEIAEDGSWSFELPEENALEDGNYNVVVTGQDVLNNAAVATESFTIDVHLPTVSIDDQDAVPSIPTFSGVAEHFDGEITVVVNGETYTVTPEENGDWAFTLPAGDLLSDGSYEVVVTAADGQGNSVSASDEITIDEELPFIAIDTQDIVDDDQPTVSGSSQNVEGDITVTINNESYLVTPDGNGDWEIQIPDGNELPDGDYSIVVSGDDGQGNEVTAISNVTVDSVDDVPEISGDTSAALIEDSANVLTANGELAAEGGDPGEEFFVALNTIGAYGEFSVNENGQWDFSADNAQTAIQALAVGESLSETFSVTNADGVTTQNIEISILGTNDAPTVEAAIVSNTTESADSYDIDLLAGANDVDTSNELAVHNFSVDSGDASGIELNGSVLTVNPNAYNSLNSSAQETIQISYTIEDGFGSSIAQTATISIAGENDAPSIVHVDLGEMNEDGSLTIYQADLLVGITDDDGDVLVADDLALVSGQGQLRNNEDGTWTFEPADDWSGIVRFEYFVVDNETWVQNTAELRVEGENDIPVAGTVDLGEVIEDGELTFSEQDLLENVEDVDGDVLSVTSVSVNFGGGEVRDNGGGTWTYITEENSNEDVELIFSVSDGSSSTDFAASLGITPVNDEPSLVHINLDPMREDTSILITQNDLVEGLVDPDGDVLIADDIRLTSGQGELVNNEDGTWSFTPPENWTGEVSFEYAVVDAETFVMNTASITVLGENDNPVAGDVVLDSTEEDVPLSFSASDLLSQVSDPDGDVLTITRLELASGSGSLEEVSEGNWTFTPEQDWSGAVTMSFDVSDGSGEHTFGAEFSVTPVNDFPELSNVELPGGFEDTSLTISQADLTAGIVDVDGDFIVADDLSVDPAFGNLINNEDGTWSFTPAENFSGTITFNYVIVDSETYGFNTASLEIAEINDDPVVSGELGNSATEDDSAFSVDLLAGASDPDSSDVLAVPDAGFSITNDSSGAVSRNGNSVDIDPSAYDSLAVGESQEITVSYSIEDGNGGTVPQTLTVTITGENDGPSVSSVLTSTATEDTSAYSVDLLGGASDPDSSDVLSVSDAGFTITNDSAGAVSRNGNNVDIDPSVYDSLAVGESQEVTVSYSIEDGNGGTVPQTLTVTITGENDGPSVSTALTSSATEDDSAYSVNLLTNASDPDGSDVLVVSASGFSISNDSAGAVSRNGNTVDIDPSVYDSLAVGESQEITVSYSIEDGNGGTVLQTLTVTITGENDGPSVSSALTSTATEDTSAYSVDLLGGASDPDSSDVLAVSNTGFSITNDSAGAVSRNGNTVDIDPSVYDSLAVGVSQEITVSYSIEDGNGGTVLQTLTVTITGENDGPSVSSVLTSTATEDASAYSVDLLGGASDPDSSDVLAVPDAGFSITNDSAGAVSRNGNNVDIDPSVYDSLAVGESQEITVSYSIEDGNGGSVPQTLTVTITGENDGPSVSSALTSTATEDTSAYSVDLLDGASDPDSSDVLVASASGFSISNDSAGAVSRNGNTVDIDPSVYDSLAVGESQEITVSYSIEDGNGGTVPQTLTVTITGENDGPSVSTALTSSATEDDSAYSVNLLTNASDPDGSDVLVVSASGFSISNDSAGAVSRNGNSVDIDPSVYDSLAVGESQEITVSYSIEDGNGGSVPQTLTVTITGENDGPSVSSAIELNTIDEDNNLIFDENDLLQNASDIDGDILNVANVELASGEGVLTEDPEGTWTFRPDGDWSGDVTITFDVTDGLETVPTSATFSVTAVADEPTINLDDSIESLGPIPPSSGLLLSFYDLLMHTDRDAANLESAIDAATPTSEERVIDGFGTPQEVADSNVIPGDGSTIAMGWQDAYSVTGLIYLEAGSTYQFQGYRDDSLRIELGGETLISTTDDSWGNYGPNPVNPINVIDQESFTAPADGFYSLEVYVNNVGGIGQFSLNMVVDGAEPQVLNSENFSIYASLEDLIGAGGQVGSFVPGADNADGGYYPQAASVGGVNTYIEIPNIEALTNDVDGSETIVSLVVGSIPSGAVLTDGTNTFEATGADQEVDVFAGGWDLTNIQILPATDFVGTFNLSVIAVSEEGSNSNRASVTENVLVTVGNASGFADGLDPDLVETPDALAPVNPVDPTNIAPEAGDPVDLGEIDEDASITFSEADLLVNASDIDGNDLSVSAVNIESGSGELVDNGDDSWTFNPGDDWSGEVALSFTVTDGQDTATGSASFTVQSVADVPSINLDETPESLGAVPPSTGLLLSFFDILMNADRDAANQEAVIDAATPTSEERVINGFGTPQEVLDTNVFLGDGSTIHLGWQDSYSVTGLIYLEAGRTYEFQGYRDDSLRVELGGETVISTTGDSWGNFGPGAVNEVIPLVQESFTAPVDGYYSLEVYTNNVGGMGQFSLNMVVDGGEPQVLNAANFNIYASVEDLLSVGGQIDSFVPGTENTDGGYYPAAISQGAANTYIEVPNIEALVTDGDDSESIVSIVVSGVPWGGVLTDGENVFYGYSGHEEIDVLGEGWDLANIQIRPTTGFTGSFNLTVTATSEESSNGDQAVSSENILITVGDVSGFADGIDPDLIDSSDVVFGSLFNEVESGTSGNDVYLADAGNDQISGLAGSDIIDGGTGNDTLLGGDDADLLYGGFGNDSILGGAGDDIIFGGAGEDIVSGGTGSDIMSGGDDVDTFVWSGSDAGGTDIVTDFIGDVGGDVLDVSALLDGESSDDLGDLATYLSFSSDGNDTTISVDIDGDGAGTDMSIVLEGIDLTLLGNDQAILQNLLDNGNIITD